MSPKAAPDYAGLTKAARDIAQREERRPVLTETLQMLDDHEARVARMKGGTLVARRAILKIEALNALEHDEVREAQAKVLRNYTEVYGDTLPLGLRSALIYLAEQILGDEL